MLSKLQADLFAVVAVAVVASACSRASAGDPVGDDPFAAQGELKAAPAPEPLVLHGVITSARTEIVVAEFDAKVDEVLVTGGQRVVAGQTLARLDDSQLRQRVEGARQATNAARAEAAKAAYAVADARRNLQTERKLFQRGAQARLAVSSASSSLSASGAAAGAASSSAKSSQFQLAELEQQLASAVIKAPIGGVVTMIKVKQGEMAQRGTRVARVFDPSDLQVRFEVPRGHRGELAVGTTIEVTIEGYDQPLRAKVIDLSGDLEAPLQFAVGTADIDDTGLSPDDGRVGAAAKVRLIGL